MSIELWYLICDVDIPASKDDDPKVAVPKLNPIPDRLEDLDKQSLLSAPSAADTYVSPYEEYLPDRRFRRQVGIAIKLQMIVARLCGIFDEVLVLERIHQREDVTPMFRNLLDYSYKSHLVLCTVIHDRLPLTVKEQNVRRSQDTC